MVSERTHDHQGIVNYNESVYVNFLDPVTQVGGLLRVGNRPGLLRDNAIVSCDSGTIATWWARAATSSPARSCIPRLERWSACRRTPFGARWGSRSGGRDQAGKSLAGRYDCSLAERPQPAATHE